MKLDYHTVVVTLEEILREFFQRIYFKDYRNIYLQNSLVVNIT